MVWFFKVMWTSKALHNFIALFFSIFWCTMLLTEAGAISTLLLVWGWKNSMKREKNGGNHLLGTNDVIKVSSLISFFPTCWYVIDDVGKLWNSLVVPAIYLKNKTFKSQYLVLVPLTAQSFASLNDDLLQDVEALVS